MQRLSPDDEAFLVKVGLEARDAEWVGDNLEEIQAGADRLYEEFSIREGEKLRPIAAPNAYLKRIQRALMRKFFYRFRPSQAAHGFVRGRSPLTNANVHLAPWYAAGRPRDWCLLEIDVENFFPSIPTNEVMRVVTHILGKRFECPQAILPKMTEIIVSLCQRNGALPMGAPTSPVISNLVMARFDAAMLLYAKRWNLTYTRYADDITVFGLNANKAYPTLKKQLDRLGLKIKSKKTRVLRYHRAMVVTGVTINSGETTVSRRFRRRVRAQIHNTRLHVEKAWSEAHAVLLKKPRPVKIPVLLGRAGWCASVNPRHRRLLDAVQGVRRVMESQGS
jgi:RNA-directed DNA polymerase